MPNPDENQNIIQLGPLADAVRREKQEGEDKLAATLRNAVKKACDPSRPVLVQADAQSNIKAQPPAEQKLTPFPNGMLFAYSPNPKRPGTFFLHDAAGLNVALAVSEEVANILCRGAHLFFQVAQKQIDEAKAKEAALVRAVEARAAAAVIDAAVDAAKPYGEEFDSPSPEAGK